VALIEVPDHLLEDVEKLVKDKGAKNAPDNSDIDLLIADKGTDEYVEYWGEEVTLKRNWQSDPEHPQTFLAYITVAEAKLLRSLGLGYSLIDHEYRQHYDKNKIPSFNGDFGGPSNAGEAEAAANMGDNNSGGGNSFDAESFFDDYNGYGFEEEFEAMETTDGNFLDSISDFFSELFSPMEDRTAEQQASYAQTLADSGMFTGLTAEQFADFVGVDLDKVGISDALGGGFNIYNVEKITAASEIQRTLTLQQYSKQLAFKGMMTPGSKTLISKLAQADARATAVMDYARDLGLKADINYDTDMAVVSIDLVNGTTLNVGTTATGFGYLESEVNEKGFVTSSTSYINGVRADYNYNDFFGYHAVSIDDTPDILGRFTGQVSRTRSVNNSIVNFSITYDVHYAQFKELGMLAEVFADIHEAFTGRPLDDELTLGTYEVLAEAIMLAVSGNIVSAAIAGIKVGIKVAQINDWIDARTAGNMLGYVAVAEYMYGAYRGALDVKQNMENLSTINKLADYGYINSATQALGVFASVMGAYQGTVAVAGNLAALSSQLNTLGYDFGVFNEEAITNYQYSLEAELASQMFTKYGNFGLVVNSYVSWYNANYSITKHSTLASVQEDPFDFMAGGLYYDIESAAGNYYYGPAARSPKVSVDRKLALSAKDARHLFQEDVLYPRLEPIDTGSQGDAGNGFAMSAARITRLNALIDSRNALVEEYEGLVDAFNLEVEAFNASLSSIKTQSAYDSAKADIETKQSELEATLGSLSADIEEFNTELESFI